MRTIVKLLSSALLLAGLGFGLTENATTANASFSSTFHQAFLTQLNKERVIRGRRPVKATVNFNRLATTRSQQIVASFSHYNAHGRGIALDISRRNRLNFFGECIGYYGQKGTGKRPGPKALAHRALYNYIYKDASSNWGHRELLLSPSPRFVGISAYVRQNRTNYQVYNAIELGR